MSLVSHSISNPKATLGHSLHITWYTTRKCRSSYPILGCLTSLLQGISKWTHQPIQIAEMKKQLPKWRMKSQGIILFRNLTSLSFSSVSGKISTSPSILHCAPPKYVHQPQHQKLCFEVSTLPLHHLFRLKTRPKIWPSQSKIAS